MTAEAPSDADLTDIIAGNVTLYTEYLERFHQDDKYALEIVKMFLDRESAPDEAGFLAQLWLEDLLAFHSDALAEQLRGLANSSGVFRTALTFVDRSLIPTDIRPTFPAP